MSAEAIKKIKKTQQYKAWIALIAIRAEFIQGPPLTKKGKGWFGPKFWRRYCYIRRLFDKKFANAMYALLTHVRDFNSIG